MSNVFKTQGLSRFTGQVLDCDSFLKHRGTESTEERERERERRGGEVGSGEWVVGSGEAEIWRLPNVGLHKPRDCPELPAKNPTTEHTEYTEGEPSSFRVFRVFRGLKSSVV